jgi:hypothetical protein
MQYHISIELQQEVQKQPLLEPKELSSISSIGVTESEDNSEKELPPNDISFAKSLLQIGILECRAATFFIIHLFLSLSLSLSLLILFFFFGSKMVATHWSIQS